MTNEPMENKTPDAHIVFDEEWEARRRRPEPAAEVQEPELPEEPEAPALPDEPEKPVPARPPQRQGYLSDNLKLILKDVLIACGIALLISFIVRPTIVKETSMEPTVEPSDYLLMNRQAYAFGEVERGDIVIFRSDLKLDETHNKLLIKRVIGLSGDTVSISGGQVYVNGKAVDEPYIAEGGTPGTMEEMTVPEGQLFVMGDHRTVSVDSRVLGCIDEDDIEGKAFFRLYPFSKFGRIE